jgi:Holliday junction resolvase
VNKRDKGNRAEREVVDALEAEGYLVHRAQATRVRFGNMVRSISHDIFGIFDIVAVDKAGSSVFIQICSTESDASKRRSKIEATLGKESRTMMEIYVLARRPQNKWLVWLRSDYGKWKRLYEKPNDLSLIIKEL